MKSQKLNYELTEYATKHGILKQYAFYVCCKSLFERHTIVFNYNPTRLGRLTGKHRKTVSRYVEKLTAHGFCTMHSGNLLFRNQDKIATDLNLDPSIKRKIPITNNFNEILTQLEYLLLKTHDDRQYYRGFRKLKTKIAPNLSMRQFQRSYAKFAIRTYHSSRSVGKLFGCSNVTANVKIKKLVHEKLIETKEIIRTICTGKISFQYFYPQQVHINANRPGYFFYKGDSVYVHTGLKIKFF